MQFLAVPCDAFRYNRDVNCFRIVISRRRFSSLDLCVFHFHKRMFAFIMYLFQSETACMIYSPAIISYYIWILHIFFLSFLLRFFFFLSLYFSHQFWCFTTTTTIPTNRFSASIVNVACHYRFMILKLCYFLREFIFNRSIKILNLTGFFNFIQISYRFKIISTSADKFFKLSWTRRFRLMLNCLFGVIICWFNWGYDCYVRSVFDWMFYEQIVGYKRRYYIIIMICTVFVCVCFICVFYAEKHRCTYSSSFNAIALNYILFSACLLRQLNRNSLTLALIISHFRMKFTWLWVLFARVFPLL